MSDKIKQIDYDLDIGYGKTENIRLYEFEGQRGVSISTAPSIFVPLSLQDYYRNKSKNAQLKASNKAKELGTQAHALLEKEETEEPEPPKEELREWFDDWKKVKTDWNIAPAEYTELKVFSRVFATGGKIDRIGAINGKRYVIDYKTGRFSFLDLWKTTAYRELYVEMSGDLDVGVMVIYLPKPDLVKQGHKPKKYTVTRYESCFATWLGLYDAFKMQYHKELIKAGMTPEDVYSKGTFKLYERENGIGSMKGMK